MVYTKERRLAKQASIGERQPAKLASTTSVVIEEQEPSLPDSVPEAISLSSLSVSQVVHIPT